MREVTKQRQLLFDLRDYDLPSSMRSDIAQADEIPGNSPVSHSTTLDLSHREPDATPREDDVLVSLQANGHEFRHAFLTGQAQTRVGEAVASLCRRIVQRVPKLRIPAVAKCEPADELNWKLRGLAIPFSFSEDRPSGGRWPENRLDGDDNRRLCVLSNLSGKPLNGLLHFAVHTLFDEVRTLMTQLLDMHERSGTPLAELLEQVLAEDSIVGGHADTKADRPSPETKHLAERHSHATGVASRCRSDTTKGAAARSELAAESGAVIANASDELCGAEANLSCDEQCRQRSCKLATTDINDGDAGKSTRLDTTANSSTAHASSLIRPDRQLTYDGLPPSEWPRPVEDRQTITVDRVRADIDGPPHRFVIRCGDVVEVFFSRNRVELAQVLDVSHAERLAQVRVSADEVPFSISVDNVFPTPVETSGEWKRTVRGPHSGRRLA